MTIPNLSQREYKLQIPGLEEVTYVSNQWEQRLLLKFKECTDVEAFRSEFKSFLKKYPIFPRPLDGFYQSRRSYIIHASSMRGASKEEQELWKVTSYIQIIHLLNTLFSPSHEMDKIPVKEAAPQPLTPRRNRRPDA